MSPRAHNGSNGNGRDKSGGPREGGQKDNGQMLELIVNNHPGVMSHVCGLFSRRAYNVEAIVCLPVGRGDVSRVRLLVNEDERLDLLCRQLARLNDILEVKRVGPDNGAFTRLEQTMRREAAFA